MSKTDHNPPRPYDLDDPKELRRLYAETLGYLRTCLSMGHGTDFKGRQHAMDALGALLAASIAREAAERAMDREED